MRPKAVRPPTANPVPELRAHPTSPPTYAAIASRTSPPQPSSQSRNLARDSPSPGGLAPSTDGNKTLPLAPRSPETAHTHRGQRDEAFTDLCLSVVQRRLADVVHAPIPVPAATPLLASDEAAQRGPQLTITIGRPASASLAGSPSPNPADGNTDTDGGHLAPPDQARRGSTDSMAAATTSGRLSPSLWARSARPRTPVSPLSAASGRSTPMREAFERIDTARALAKAVAGQSGNTDYASALKSQGGSGPITRDLRSLQAAALDVTDDIEGVLSMLSVVVASPASYMPPVDAAHGLSMDVEDEGSVRSNLATAPSSPVRYAFTPVSESVASAGTGAAADGQHERTKTVPPGGIGSVDPTRWRDAPTYPLASSTTADRGSMYEYNPPASPPFSHQVSTEQDGSAVSPAQSTAQSLTPASPPPAVSPVSMHDRRAETDVTEAHLGDMPEGQARAMPATPIQVAWPPPYNAQYTGDSVQAAGTPNPYPSVPRILDHTFSPMSVDSPSVLQSPHHLVPDQPNSQFGVQGLYAPYLPFHAGPLYPYGMPAVHGQYYGSPTYVSTDYAPSGHDASPYGTSGGFVSPWSSPAAPPQAYLGAQGSPYTALGMAPAAGLGPHPHVSPYMIGHTPFNSPKRLGGGGSPHGRRARGGRGGGGGGAKEQGQAQAQVLEKQRLEHARMIRDLKTEYERAEAEREWELAKLRQEVELGRRAMMQLREKLGADDGVGENEDGGLSV